MTDTGHGKSLAQKRIEESFPRPSRVIRKPVPVVVAVPKVEEFVEPGLRPKVRPVVEEKLQKVKEAVVYLTNLTIEQLESPSRKRCIARPRQVAMYFSRMCLQRDDLELYTLKQIKVAYCRDDHTTVMHAVEKIEELRRDGGRCNDDADALELLQKLCEHFEVSLPELAPSP